MYALECRLNYWHCLRAVLVAASGPALEGCWGMCVSGGGGIFSLKKEKDLINRCFVESGTTPQDKITNPNCFGSRESGYNCMVTP